MSQAYDSKIDSQTSSVSNGCRKTASHGELYGLTCKVMLIGDSGVGKTCILVRFKNNTFLGGSFISTVGIDFRTEVINVDGTKVKLQIWDTAGQERFRSITRAYYRDADALLLLYDVTKKMTFENIRAWLCEIKDYGQEDVLVLLIGNKSDLEADREVSTREGELLAKENNIPFMETSAKSGKNVKLVFTDVAKRLKVRKMDSSMDMTSSLNDLSEQDTQPGQRQGCCGR